MRKALSLLPCNYPLSVSGLDYKGPGNLESLLRKPFYSMYDI